MKDINFGKGDACRNIFLLIKYEKLSDFFKNHFDNILKIDIIMKSLSLLKTEQKDSALHSCVCTGCIYAFHNFKQLLIIV